jgi:hypothetical protein
MEFLIHQNKLLMVQVYPKQKLNFKKKKKEKQSKNSIQFEKTYDRANFKSLANATLGDKQ